MKIISFLKLINHEMVNNALLFVKNIATQNVISLFLGHPFKYIYCFTQKTVPHLQSQFYIENLTLNSFQNTSNTQTYE